MASDDLRIDSLLVHADRHVRGPSGDVTPPIHPTSTFAATDRALAAAATTPRNSGVYTRYGNPNHDEVAAVVARLEGTEAAMPLASGMAAISTTALALLDPGDHVVLQRGVYGGTATLATGLLARMGITHTAVDQADIAAWDAAIGPSTRLVLIETPSNPRVGITDIAAVSAHAHAHGAIVAVDSTFASPIHQRPFEHGADLVLHSATKYLGGHSDLIAGIVAGPDDLLGRIWETAIVTGGTLGPIDAWLLLRGLRTLGIRMARHSANAAAVAAALHAHPAVARVDHPSLPSDPGHAVAQRQMTGGFGGVLAFDVSDATTAERVIDGMRLAQRAVSLGGVESLVVRPAAMWPAGTDDDALERAGITAGLIRLAVGVEDPDDLVADVVSAVDRGTTSAPGRTDH
ncbi:MAG: aminotransferase class V-fold PLP-dependent enzyme [Patulibacter sp.]|nr:aminotransferase class V-fold PLP-dependent enzyme [Patulibacter sp.]